jgi:hypothetical protein
MKALFLIWHRSGRKIEAFYEFIPYMYGPCSFDLYRELAAAEREKLVIQAPHMMSRWARYFLTQRGKDVATQARQKIDHSSLALIQSVAEEVASAGFHDLLRRVYAEAPDFATQSVINGEPRR